MAPDTFAGLTHAPTAHLEQLMRSSAAPAMEALIDFEWRGFNTSWQPRLLGIQKFIKGFFEFEGQVEGYNIPVAQNGLSAPWLALPSPEQPRRYAFFTVAPAAAAPDDQLFPRALLLNYGASARNADAPALALRLRDYLVQPDPAAPHILLGKAYLALASMRVPSGFFILERLRPTAWRP